MEDATPASEEQVLAVMQNLFNTQYGLEKEDREIVARLMHYGKDMGGLSDKEIAQLKKCNLMDTDGKFMIEKSFYFRGLVIPAYWLKCLMALHGMIAFTIPKVENPNEIKTK